MTVALLGELLLGKLLDAFTPILNFKRKVLVYPQVVTEYYMLHVYVTEV